MVFASAPREETILPSLTSMYIAPQRPAVKIALPGACAAQDCIGIAEVIIMAPAEPPAYLIKLRRVRFIGSPLLILVLLFPGGNVFGVVLEPARQDI